MTYVTCLSPPLFALQLSGLHDHTRPRVVTFLNSGAPVSLPDTTRHLILRRLQPNGPLRLSDFQLCSPFSLVPALQLLASDCAYAPHGILYLLNFLSDMNTTTHSIFGLRNYERTFEQASRRSTRMTSA
jgi:hypothetical protein